MEYPDLKKNSPDFSSKKRRNKNEQILRILEKYSGKSAGGEKYSGKSAGGNRIRPKGHMPQEGWECFSKSSIEHRTMT